MKYMGSKNRIAKDILPIILKDRKPDQWYVEPFCGGCNLIDKVEGKRLANDRNGYVVEMWRALVHRSWQPPLAVTEAEYKDIKYNKSLYQKELVGFAGVALSFGSTWFGTYARNSRGTNYALEGRKNLMAQVERLQGVIFSNNSYENMVIPSNSIVYCDPPYAGVTGYKDGFSHPEFWDWVRKKSVEGHKVFVSEYNAPSDFDCVWSKELPNNINKNTLSKKAIERLFTYSDLF